MTLTSIFNHISIWGLAQKCLISIEWITNMMNIQEEYIRNKKKISFHIFGHYSKWFLLQSVSFSHAGTQIIWPQEVYYLSWWSNRLDIVLIIHDHHLNTWQKFTNRTEFPSLPRTLKVKTNNHYIARMKKIENGKLRKLSFL